MVTLEIKICQTQIKYNYLFRLLIIGGFGSVNTNVLLNLKIHKDIDKIYSCDKNIYETKYYILINKRESMVLKHFMI